MAQKEGSIDQMAKPVPADLLVQTIPGNIPLAIPGPVDDERLSPHILNWDKTPETAVETAIPVIPQDKDLFRGDPDRPEIIPFLNRSRQRTRLLEYGMGIGDRRPVDMQLFVDDLNRVPLNGRNAFDEILVAVVWINENDDIPFFRFLERHQIQGGKRNLDSENEFVHQNMVSDLQGGLHGPGGNLERLHHKGADQHRQGQSDDDRFRIFAKCGFFLDFWIFQGASPFVS